MWKKKSESEVKSFQFNKWSDKYYQNLSLKITNQKTEKNKFTLKNNISFD